MKFGQILITNKTQHTLEIHRFCTDPLKGLLINLSFIEIGPVRELASQVKEILDHTSDFLKYEDFKISL